MRITSLQSFMTKCSCDIFIFTHYRYVKIQKKKKRRIREGWNRLCPMGTIVHCTRLSGTLSQLSTYILALVLINSGYSIIDEKSMTLVERENYFLSFIFKTLDSQTFSQGAASLRSVTVFIGKWRKLRPIKKAIGKSRKLTKM